MTKYFDQTLVTNEIQAEFSHRHAAVAAGIAELGWNGLTLTPEFGSMQRLNTLLTSAELEPTPLYTGPPLCLPDKCKKKCVHLCPAKAFSETEAQSCVVGEKTLTYAVHDNVRCLYGVTGMIKGSGGRSDMQIADGPGQAASFFADYLAEDNLHPYDKAMLDNCFGIICGDFCGKCLHQCPSKKLCAKDLKDYDFSSRHSSINRSRL